MIKMAGKKILNDDDIVSIVIKYIDENCITMQLC